MYLCVNKTLQAFWNKNKSKKRTGLKGQAEVVAAVKAVTSALLHTHGYVLCLMVHFRFIVMSFHLKSYFMVFQLHRQGQRVWNTT